MSSPEIAQVLAQMRTIQAQAGMQTPQEAQPASDVSFSDMLKRSVDAVNEVQQESAKLKTDFEHGVENVDLAQVMVASQKANLSFTAMVEVRNKLVDAYKDVMNMPI